MAVILDQYGQPIPRQLRGKFDLAQTTRNNAAHWGNADSKSARTALSPEVRKRMRERSRLEAENSSWYSGMLSTATNHIVGTGPRLQVTTGDPLSNARVERAWRKWSRTIGLTSLLRTAFETYWRDGECFVLKTSRKGMFPVDTDLALYESEQVQSPYDTRAIGDPYIDDGIRISPYGQGLEYYLLEHHPSDPVFTPTWDGEWKSRDEMIHLFRPVRPNQLRGYPRAASGLESLAIMRRMERATVLAAESAAKHAIVLKTTGPNVTPAASPADFATVELPDNMASILPDGWDVGQVKPEHPASTFEMFVRQQLMHLARCMNMPYGLAAGTSKDSNFSSHKGDIRNLWQAEVWAEQELLERVVMDRVFTWFLEDAVLTDLLTGLPSIEDIDHQWYWDGIPPLDEMDEANAAAERVRTGQTTLIHEYRANGQDFGTAMAQGDVAFGLPAGTYRNAVFTALFPAGVRPTPQPAAPTPAAPTGSTDEAVTAAPGGEFGSISRQQWGRNRKAIDDLLREFAAGERSEVYARTMLHSLGVSEAMADTLIEDASDGQVDPSLTDGGAA